MSVLIQRIIQKKDFDLRGLTFNGHLLYVHIYALKHLLLLTIL